MSSTLAASMALRCLRPALARSFLNVSISPKTLAVSASVYGVECHQRTVRRGQYLMHSVPELVREYHHVARPALVIEQHVGMCRGHGRMREGAGRFAGAYRRVDPVVVEEALRDRGHIG